MHLLIHISKVPPDKDDEVKFCLDFPRYTRINVVINQETEIDRIVTVFEIIKSH